VKYHSETKCRKGPEMLFYSIGCSHILLVNKSAASCLTFRFDIHILAEYIFVMFCTIIYYNALPSVLVRD